MSRSRDMLTQRRNLQLNQNNQPENTNHGLTSSRQIEQTRSEISAQPLPKISVSKKLCSSEACASW